MGFAVLHIEKGTAGKAGGLGAHIDRTKRVPNADPARQHLNFYVRPNFEAGTIDIYKTRSGQDLQTRINNRIKSGYKGKTAIRKDAVTHLNIVLTGSHEEMTTIGNDPKRLKNWATENYKFIAKQYGLNNIVEFSIHMEERTPHAHCVVVPLTKDGRLSAKEVMGDRRKMSKLQDDYGKLMDEHFGLKRGIKGSQATHDSIQEYYGRIDQALQTQITPIEITPKVSASKQIIPVPPLIGRKEWAEKQNKTVLGKIIAICGDYKQKAEIMALEAAKALTAQNTEDLARLRKQNAQLNGVIRKREVTIRQQRKEIDNLKNPQQEHSRNRGRGL